MRRSFEVTPNIVGVARHPERVAFPLADGRDPIVFDQVRFEPLEGFTIDEESGELIVSDDPAALSYRWVGRHQRLDVFLVVDQGMASALLYGEGIRYSLAPAADARHMFRELDADRVDRGRCANAAFAENPEVLARVLALARSPAEKIESSALPRSSKRSAQITIMIYYTERAAALYGGPTGLSVVADNLITQLNEALRNTEDTYFVNVSRAPELRLLQVPPLREPPVAYNERVTNDPETDPLRNQGPRIENPNTRFTNHLESLIALEVEGSAPNRQSQGADFAILLVADTGNPAPPPDPSNPNLDEDPNAVFGISLVQSDRDNTGILFGVGSEYRSFAYGVVSVGLGVQNLTFAHEVGHMLGSGHDLDNGFPAERVAYSFAYGRRVPLIARDIMADPKCVDLDGPGGAAPQCTHREVQFSNPRVTFRNVIPTVQSGTPTTDVARAIGCLADASGSLYPVSELQLRPEIFWSGFEFGSPPMDGADAGCAAILNY